jgi:hypothetical protein
MPPTDLNVPFHEKELAKQLGARWDARRRTWYVPDGTDASALTRWFPPPVRITLRTQGYYIAQTVCVCWKCEQPSDAWGLVLPPGHEALTAIDEPPPHIQTDAQIDAWEQSEESSAWVEQDCAAVALRVRHLPESAQRRISRLTGAYYRDFSATVQLHYWMNHCTACGMKQGDFTLIEEFDAPLQPLENPSRILLHVVDEPLELEAGSIDYEPDIFERMTRLETGRP